VDSGARQLLQVLVETQRCQWQDLGFVC
jgi:hypothetical protein